MKLSEARAVAATDEFEGLSVRTKNALRNAGLQGIADVLAAPPSCFRAVNGDIKNLGAKGIDELDAFLAARGLSRSGAPLRGSSATAAQVVELRQAVAQLEGRLDVTQQMVRLLASKMGVITLGGS